MSGLLDAYGRPFQKQEVESLARRGLMLPASVLFGSVADNLSENSTPFVVSSQSLITDPQEEMASIGCTEVNRHLPTAISTRVLLTRTRFRN